MRRLVDVGLGEAQGRPSRSCVELIAPPIRGLLQRRPMEARVVDLDDEVELGPEEVDAPALELDLCLRHQDPVLAEDAEER